GSVNAAPTIRLARPDDEGKVSRLLDEAFASPGRESLLWSMLRREYPEYDPELAFVAERSPRELEAFLLVHPRTLWIRGAEVPCGVLSPFAVAPSARGEGLGARLVQHALAACAKRFELVVLLGEPRYFQRFGFRRAFGHSRVRARLPRDLAALAGEGWRAIGGGDLAACRELYELAYAGVSGTERRTLAAVDWDSRAQRTHVLVRERAGRVGAYARFHLGTSIAVAECAASSAEDAEALLGFLARLGVEHARESCEVLVPRHHPLVRPLLRAGGELATHDMTGAVLAWCPEPRRLLARLLAGGPALAAHARERWEAFELELPGATCRIEPAANGARVAECSAPSASHPSASRLALREERLVGWLTGLEPLREALVEQRERQSGDDAAFRALDRLMPETESLWSWSPLYDVVGW
ncbi:MAG: N-acetyltransferase, partial [Planctomycetes bacterium]|nr:N-acetyltransferase [Planctomycetota bacterium]